MGVNTQIESVCSECTDLREQNAQLLREIAELRTDLAAALHDIEVLEIALSEPKFRKRGRRGEDD